jgi:hypothetical protein
MFYLFVRGNSQHQYCPTGKTDRHEEADERIRCWEGKHGLECMARDTPSLTKGKLLYTTEEGWVEVARIVAGQQDEGT